MQKRNTIQKAMILQAVGELKNHPTAEEVYAHVVQRHPSISKATVYRNLSGLAEDGQLMHIYMPDGADRFDHNCALHDHIVCTQCGCVKDIPNEEADALDAAAAAATGFSSVQHTTVFRGVCAKCAKRS